MWLGESRRDKVPEREYRILESRSRFLKIFLNPPFRNEALLLFIAVASVATGVGAWGVSGDPGAVLEGLLAIGAASAAGGVVAGWRRGRSLSGLLPGPLVFALTGALVTGVFFVAGAAVGHRHAALAFGYAWLFPFAHIVSALLEGRPPHRHPPRTGAQPLFGMLLLFLLRPETLSLAPRAAVATALLTAGGVFLYHSAERRLLARVGIPVRAVISFYREAVLGRTPNIRSLVKGEEADLWVDALAFRGAGGGPMKAVLVTTSVHPGFIRPIESADMPRRVGRLLEDLGPAVVLKGAATHEQDPMEDVSEEIARGVREAVGRMAFSPEAGEPARAVQGRAVATVRRIGPAAMAVTTFAPHPTDDVDVRVHAEVEAAARELGFPLFFVDAHNCHGPEGMTVAGTDRAGELVAASRVALKSAVASPPRKLRLGVSRRPFGAVLLFETVPGDRRDLLVVLDENNMLPSARKVLREVLSVPGVVHGDAMEFCTSDTHRTIDVGTVHNPLAPEDVERRTTELRTMLYEAERSLEEVEAGYGRSRLRTAVFGRKILEMKAFWEEEARRGRWFYGPFLLSLYAAAVAVFIF
ncbi:MAG: DUF2070 family protein [Halobacteria archaeon]